MKVTTLTPTQALHPAYRKVKIVRQDIVSTADTSALEAEIDVLVYKLYGLSYAEVLVVDAGFGLSEREYGKMELG